MRGLVLLLALALGCSAPAARPHVAVEPAPEPPEWHDGAAEMCLEPPEEELEPEPCD